MRALEKPLLAVGHRRYARDGAASRNRMSFRTLRRRREDASANDVCLLAKAKAGDAAAFSEFYERYAQRVLIFTTRRALDVELALDLTSETFAVALATCRQFRGRTDEEEQAWLFAIARSQLSRYWRRGAVERQALCRLGIEVPSLDDAEIERVETLAGLHDLKPRLTQAIDALPRDQRQAIELRVVEELDYAEVAERLNATEQVVRARVSRGLRALGRALAETSTESEAVV